MGILTEEELSDIEDNLKCDLDNKAISQLLSIFASHRAIQERNRNLVLENDEQTAEIERKNRLITNVRDHLEGVMNPNRFIIFDGPGALKMLNQALEEAK